MAATDAILRLCADVRGLVGDARDDEALALLRDCDEAEQFARTPPIDLLTLRTAGVSTGLAGPGGT